MNKVLEETFKPRTLIAYAIIGVFLYKTMTSIDPIQTKLIDLLINLVMAQQGYYYGSRLATQTKGEIKS